MRSSSVSRNARIASSHSKALNEFGQDEPQGFRHAAVHFQQSRKVRKKLLLGCMAPLAAAEERHARPGEKSSRGKRNPGKHLLPGQRAVEGRSNQQRERNHAGQNDRAPRAPANSGRQRHE